LEKIEPHSYLFLLSLDEVVNPLLLFSLIFHAPPLPPLGDQSSKTLFSFSSYFTCSKTLYYEGFFFFVSNSNDSWGYLQGKMGDKGDK